MPGRAAADRVAWQTATVVDDPDGDRRAPRRSGSRCREPSPHLAGQHYVVRLTAPDGYTASRSYSVASRARRLRRDRADRRAARRTARSRRFLHDEVVVGDELEVRGPIGGWFVWDGDTPGAAGRRRLRRRAADGDAAAGPRAPGRADLVRLVVSVRTPDDLYYADELPGPGDRPSSTPARRRRRRPRPAGRLAAADLAAADRCPTPPRYVCGSAGFADAASRPARRRSACRVDRIRVERFGPTGP